MRLRTRLTVFTTLFLAAVLIATALAVYAFTERSLLKTSESRLEDFMQNILERPFSPNSISSLPNDSYFLVKLFPFEAEKASDIKTGGTTFRSGEFAFDALKYNVSKPTAPAQADRGEQLIMQSDYYDDVNALNEVSRTRKYHFNPDQEDLFNNLSESDLNALFSSGKLNTRISNSRGRVYLAAIKKVTFLNGIGSRTIDVPSYTLIAIPFPQEVLNRLRFLLFLTAIIAFIAFAFGVNLLAARVLAPMKNMTKAAGLIGGKDLSLRIPVPKSGGELSDLAITINNMLERLQESFETQQRFTGYASHELRTPVTVIAGHANYLLRRTELSDDQADSLATIHNEANRMAKLVNDLLELARADAGLTIKREPMNLVEVLEDVKNEVQPVTDAEIKLNISEPLIEISGDASRLKQVILNLLQNALNAGSKEVTISLEKDGDDIRLEIFDNGPGIPEDAIPHLFERFYRVDAARTKKGSGLGLAIVKWIVSQHGGTVSVESRVGEGSVFTIILPSLDSMGDERNIIPSQLRAAAANAKDKPPT